jgi:hypothetical protein
MELDRPRIHARHVAARLRRQAAGHALVHGRPQHLRRTAADCARPAQGHRARFSLRRADARAEFAAGELDALLSLYIPKLFLEGSPTISRLFPNYKEVEGDYYRRTRILPIMHTVVLREDVYRQHPWAARRIYRAFAEARDLAVGGLYDTDALRVALPWLIDHVEEARRVFGADFWAYGLEPNRPTLAAIGRYVHEQGLSPRIVSADELFAPGVE